MKPSFRLQQVEEGVMSRVMALANVVAAVFAMALDLPIPLQFP